MIHLHANDLCKVKYLASTSVITLRCRYKPERNSGSLMTVGAHATVDL